MAIAAQRTVDSDEGNSSRRRSSPPSQHRSGMPKYRNEEFATSSDFVAELRDGKEALRAQNFPLEASRAFVRQYLQPERFSHLAEKAGPITYLVAPSTSGTNILPRLFADELKRRFGGQVVQNWTHPLNETRTGLKTGAIAKIRDPMKEIPETDVISKLNPASRFVLVDDMVITGGTVRAMREGLHAHGLNVSEVVSLAQWDLRKVNERDIERISEKLNDPQAREAVAGVLGGQLKQFGVYIERTLTDGNQNDRLEIRNYLVAEYQRLRTLGLAYSGATHGIAGGAERASGAQRPQSAGAELSSGVSREGGGVRGSKDRSESRRALADELLGKLEALRERWPKATSTAKQALVQSAGTIVDELGGSGVTKVPLRVAAKDFVQGKKGAKEDLVRRAAAHAQTLTKFAAHHRGRGQDVGRGMSH